MTKVKSAGVDPQYKFSSCWLYHRIRLVIKVYKRAAQPGLVGDLSGCRDKGVPIRIIGTKERDDVGTLNVGAALRLRSG